MLRVTAATRAPAKPRPRKSGCVQTALTSAKPGGANRWPAIAARRPSTRVPRQPPSLAVWARSARGSVRAARATISGKSVDFNGTMISTRGAGWGDGRAHHLNERSTAENLPIRRRLGWAFEKEDGDIALRHNGGQVGVCLGCLFLDAGERAYVRRIAAC